MHLCVVAGIHVQHLHDILIGAGYKEESAAHRCTVGRATQFATCHCLEHIVTNVSVLAVGQEVHATVNLADVVAFIHYHKVANGYLLIGDGCGVTVVA